MPRALLLRTRVFPYHVYGRCNNKEWFYLPISEMWKIFNEIMGIVVERYGFHIHCFVLMSNHYHLIVSTPQANLDEAMLYFVREVAKTVNRKTSRINHVFGGPYKWSLLDHKRAYEHAFKYVYRNPVEAAMCSKVENYPFSTLQFSANPSSFTYKLSNSIFENCNQYPQTPSMETLHWLNHPYEEDEKLNIRNALKHRRFKFSGRLSIPLARKLK